MLYKIQIYCYKRRYKNAGLHFFHISKKNYSRFNHNKTLLSIRKIVGKNCNKSLI